MSERLSGWWSRISLVPAFLRSRARIAAAEKRYADAAPLYEELARLRPENARIAIQSGHMRKEAGDLVAAERHYLRALRHLPDDADLALQLGHFYKVKGEMDRALEHYSRALALRPDWEVPQAELQKIAEAGWSQSSVAVSYEEALSGVARDAPAPICFDREADALAGAADLAHLVPQLAPHNPADLLHEHRESIEVRRLGRREPSFWGVLPTLRGVEAIRGFCISTIPIVEMQVLINGMAIQRSPIKRGYTLEREIHRERVKKYVFNAWHDFSGFAPGRYKVEVRLFDADHEVRSFHDVVVIAPPLSGADYPLSDGIVPISEADPRVLEQRIRAAPSIVRPARRQRFPNGVRNILVLRTDQLGDMVASVSAMMRLRELVPAARIVGLLTAANADLARTLGIFDEIITIDFPDDRFERRRLMPLAEQEALRRRLAAYDFDVAMDLAHSNVSRSLLRLSGAKFTHGMGGGDWHWMGSEVVFDTRDRWNGMETTPHSSKVMAVVESLGIILRSNTPVIQRPDLSRELLAPFLPSGSREFILLHAGARVGFSRWPKYKDLAQRLLDETDLSVVLMSEDAGAEAALPAELRESDRFRFIGHRLDFDIFDAFISFAKVVVGNDSGPKHLASLRGTNVVTLFTARINWAEWGQENIGTIISRQVPCQGCAIFHDEEECGKDFTCIVDIDVREVFEAIMQYV